MRTLSALILTMALAAAAASAGDKKKDDPSQIGNRDVGKGVNFYSLEKEMALGKALAQQVQRQAKMVDDPLMSEYLNRLCQNLARNSDAQVPLSCQIIDGQEPNAFALPGGYIFVYSGLIEIADEEDELAGAVAHEIAHVAARHMTRLATRNEIANLATIPLSVLLGGWTGYAVRQGAGLAIPMTFLKFNRADESEADYLGVQYMYAAGYDPNGALSIFEKIESLRKTKPGLMARVVSTHPMDADRIRKTQQEIQQILPAKPEYVVTTSEYRAMRDRLIGLGDRPKTDNPDAPARPPTIRRVDLVD